MVEIPEPVTRWNVGDRVEIISRPKSTGATVKEIAKIMRGENVFDISYRLPTTKAARAGIPKVRCRTMMTIHRRPRRTMNHPQKRRFPDA